MVYLTIPSKLTEEEELLLKKYSKLKRKKAALLARRAPKPEPPPPDVEEKPAAADATARAKKLLKLGAIKVATEKKEHQIFKRSKRHKEAADKTPAGYQPFTQTQGDGDDGQADDPSEPKAKKPHLTSQPFVPAQEPDDGGHTSHMPREHIHRPRRRRGEDREPPKKGNTIYVSGQDISEDKLRVATGNFGKVINVNMEPMKGCAFVTFETMQSADEAIASLNGSTVGDVQIKVDMARRQPHIEASSEASDQSWQSIASSRSTKGRGDHKDKRVPIAYNDDDMFL